MPVHTVIHSVWVKNCECLGCIELFAQASNDELRGKTADAQGGKCAACGYDLGADFELAAWMDPGVANGLAPATPDLYAVHLDCAYRPHGWRYQLSGEPIFVPQNKNTVKTGFVNLTIALMFPDLLPPRGYPAMQRAKSANSGNPKPTVEHATNSRAESY